MFNKCIQWLFSPLNCKLNYHEWVSSFEERKNCTIYRLKCINCCTKSSGWEFAKIKIKEG